MKIQNYYYKSIKKVLLLNVVALFILVYPDKNYLKYEMNKIFEMGINTGLEFIKSNPVDEINYLEQQALIDELEEYEGDFNPCNPVIPDNLNVIDEGIFNPIELIKYLPQSFVNKLALISNHKGYWKFNFDETPTYKELLSFMDVFNHFVYYDYVGEFCCPDYDDGDFCGSCGDEYEFLEYVKPVYLQEIRKLRIQDILKD